jgi:voltage-gated potassium channel Kch
MSSVSRSDRLRYAFDNFMARGTVALVAGLAVLSLLIVLVAGAFIATLRIAPPAEDGYTVGEAAWLSLMRTLDAGTMGGDEGVAYRITMLGVTLGGIFIVSALIGVLNTGLEQKLDSLRKGRSRVIELDHTVILGWSPQIFTIVSELVVANESRKNACIVILSTRDKLEMEADIRDKVGDTKNTRVVCRSGLPVDLVDLEIASPHTSRSIIVLPDDDDPDFTVIKTLLAVINNPKRRAEPYHVVAQIRDAQNVEVARLVGGNEAELVLVGDLVSRIMAQTCRQSGLSVVYTELLDYGGDEIYFHNEPALAGKTFGEAMQAFEKSVVIGVQAAGGESRLNPPMTTTIGVGDELIVIAADDDAIRMSSRAAAIDESAMAADAGPAPAPERSLILGWSEKAPAIVRELGQYVAPGSAVTIVSSHAGAREDIDAQCGSFDGVTVECVTGEITDRRTLDALDVTSYHHVMILSSSDLADNQQADSRTFVALLQLRDIITRSGKDISVVSEMRDLRNRTLAGVTKADDFIVSDQLVSLLLAQVSENKRLNAVFADVFDADGSEIYLKPIGRYVLTGRPVTFATVVEAARRHGEVAIGYRIRSASGDATRAYGVTINPAKSDPVSFAPGDAVVVIAES